MAIYSDFCENRSVLFSTDVAARGLDFNKAVDWVVQVSVLLLASCLNSSLKAFRWGLEGKSFLLWLESNFSLTFMQVDCPENVASYIHRVGRTARYKSDGKSVLFLLPSETQMLEKLEAAKVPVHLVKVHLLWKCI